LKPHHSFVYALCTVLGVWMYTKISVFLSFKLRFFSPYIVSINSPLLCLSFLFSFASLLIHSPFLQCISLSLVPISPPFCLSNLQHLFLSCHCMPIYFYSFVIFLLSLYFIHSSIYLAFQDVGFTVILFGQYLSISRFYISTLCNYECTRLISTCFYYLYSDFICRAV
jgi:hypothetical protein